MSSLFPPVPPADAPRDFSSLFYQEKYWATRERVFVEIASMSLSHVESALAFLLARAGRYSAAVTLPMWSYAAMASEAAADAIEAEAEKILSDPTAWMKSTPLYRALKKRRKALRKAEKRAAKERARECEMREAVERLTMLPDIRISLGGIGAAWDKH